MILEHEIPNGTKLYFGKSAKIKREIEHIASNILDKEGFSEIVTPAFSYHQHLSIADEKELIRLNDAKNNSLSLRADSTIDVVRIIQKRLGRNTEHKKWFYIQPTFKYPTTEQYQVGAEFMGEKNLANVAKIAIKILQEVDISYILQISNIKIPKILAKMFDELSLDDFKHTNIDKILSLDIDWLKKLVYLQYPSQIDEITSIAPKEIKDELLKMKELSDALHAKSVLAPLYYAKMLYYDELYFRVINDNEVYAMGGRYKSNELTSVGFAIYTDALCDRLNKEGQ